MAAITRGSLICQQQVSSSQSPGGPAQSPNPGCVRQREGQREGQRGADGRGLRLTMAARARFSTNSRLVFPPQRQLMAV